MEEILNQVWAYAGPAWAWLEAGLLAYAGDGGSVDWLMLGVQAGVIALVMALLMQEYAAVLIFTVVGVIVHLIVDQILPMIRDGADFALPPVTAMLYWQYIAALALGYLALITVLYIVKAIVLPR